MSLFYIIGQSVTKPQQTNEHMREVINHLTHIHLLNTIKSILTQTLEKFCKKRVYGEKTLWREDFDNLYSETSFTLLHISLNFSILLHLPYKDISS